MKSLTDAFFMKGAPKRMIFALKAFLNLKKSTEEW
jgi:hypothetical protein